MKVEVKNESTRGAKKTYKNPNRNHRGEVMLTYLHGNTVKIFNP